ncbi:MAG: carbohydrate kinase family protein [Planctomycetota bacterium]
MARGRFDCAVVGTCVADILVRPVPLGAPVGGGRLFHVGPLEATTGGMVCNTGIGLARLGLSVAAASLVGEDPWGSLIRGRLAAEGLDTTALEAAAGHATSSTAVLIDPSGERSFAHHRGACAAIDLAWVTRQLPLLARAEWVVLGYAGLLPALEPDLAAAIRLLRQAGCRVGLETGGTGGRLEDVAPALPFVDLYVPSLDEAAAQTGTRDPAAIIARYRELGGDGFLGVKAGMRGAVLSPTAGDHLEIPCLPAPGVIADTTGAGDSFLAGLLAGIIRGLDPQSAARLGAATAACCVTGLGATAGLRSYEETLIVAAQGR